MPNRSSEKSDQRHLRAAEGYLALEMYRHALKELRCITTNEGDLHTIHLYKAEAYRGLQDWAAALAEFREYARTKPGDLSSLLGIAWCQKRLGELSEAIGTMHDAYQAHPREPVVLYNLSCYYALGGQTTQALSWLGRALRLQPDLRRLIEDETDFDPIRQSPQFLKLLELCA